MTDSATPPPSTPESSDTEKAKPAPAKLPTGVIVGRGRYSTLIVWMLRLFLFFQGLAIVQALLDIAWPTNFIDVPAVILGFSCLQNFSVITMVLAVSAWMLAKTNRYQPNAVRLAKLVVLHFVLRLIGMFLAAATIGLLVLSAVPNLFNNQNAWAALQDAVSQMVNDHPLLFRGLHVLVLVFELTFTGLALLARRNLRGGHFLPAEPAAARAEKPAAGDAGGQSPVPAAADRAAVASHPDNPPSASSAQAENAAPPASPDAPVGPDSASAPASPPSPPSPPSPRAGGGTSPSGE